MEKLDDRYVRLDESALTFAGTDPNIPETLTVTGITEPVDSDPLVLTFDGVVESTTFWRSADSEWACWSDGAEVRLYQIVGEVTLYSATKASPLVSPVGLTDWTEIVGAGQPVITGDAPVALFLGQLCRASTAWWIWNGTVWIPWATLDGSPVAYNATQSVYQKLVVSGASGSEQIDITTI